MKRFVLGVTLLAALLMGSLAVGRGVEQAGLPVVGELKQALSLAGAGAGEAALRAVEQAKAQWDRGWQFVAAFADHEPLEEVDDLFAALSAYLPDSEEFKAYCGQIIQRAEAVIRDQSLNWWNLL